MQLFADGISKKYVYLSINVRKLYAKADGHSSFMHKGNTIYFIFGRNFLKAFDFSRNTHTTTQAMFNILMILFYIK